MLCFVVEQSHSTQSPHASTYNSEHEQCLFRYAPPSFLGLELIYTIQGKCNGIYTKQVVHQQGICIHNLIQSAYCLHKSLPDI